MNNFMFQYCQKIVVVNEKDATVLLCKRKGENDYDGVYSFIGGKMETTDKSIADGLKREKNEEVGDDIKLDVLFDYHTSTFFKKKDGNNMILPHYYARYMGGDIVLSDEYSEYRRVSIDELDNFEPKIHTVPIMVRLLIQIIGSLGDNAKYLRI